MLQSIQQKITKPLEVSLGYILFFHITEKLWGKKGRKRERGLWGNFTLALFVIPFSLNCNHQLNIKKKYISWFQVRLYLAHLFSIYLKGFATAIFERGHLCFQTNIVYDVTWNLGWEIQEVCHSLLSCRTWKVVAVLAGSYFTR